MSNLYKTSKMLIPLSKEEWRKYLAEMSLSMSGWRRVFSYDRQEHSLDTRVQEQDFFFLQRVATVISESKAIFGGLAEESLHLVVARDSRPTGAVMQAVLVEELSKRGVRVSLLDIVSLPQCLAYVKKTAIDGFVYITASHNPTGHNGLKIGSSEGKMLSVASNKKLTTSLIKEQGIEQKKYSRKEVVKKISLSTSSKSYKTLIRETMMGSDIGDEESRLKVEKEFRQMKKQMKTSLGNKFTVVCDFNGSSRLRSYDERFYQDWGINFESLNDKVGEFAHGMVPEGKSLNDLKKNIMNSFSKSSFAESFLFGYAVDCDGDRGNLVLVERIKNQKNQEDKKRYRVKVPDAQTTFALSVWSELLFCKLFFLKQFTKLVVVANGPTSLRIDKICDWLGVKMVRAEVGEINVITLAEQMIRKGQVVRILGEGSNGGNITLPSTVRDPLSMVGAIFKLLFLKCGDNFKQDSLRAETIRLLDLDPTLLDNPLDFLTGLVKKLNSFYSTDLFSDEALLYMKIEDPKAFKNRFEDLFEKEFKKKLSFFKGMGITEYEWIHYEETKTKLGKGNRKNHTGGLKVMLYGGEKGARVKKGFLWFRGSKTEKVLRFSAESDTLKGQKSLLAFCRELLERVGVNR